MNPLPTGKERATFACDICGIQGECLHDAGLFGGLAEGTISRLEARDILGHIMQKEGMGWSLVNFGSQSSICCPTCSPGASERAKRPVLVMPFRLQAECSKCGQSGPSMQYLATPPYPGQGQLEHIRCKCQRCGFTWAMQAKSDTITSPQPGPDQWTPATRRNIHSSVKWTHVPLPTSIPWPPTSCERVRLFLRRIGNYTAK